MTMISFEVAMGQVYGKFVDENNNICYKVIGPQEIAEFISRKEVK